MAMSANSFMESHSSSVTEVSPMKISTVEISPCVKVESLGRTKIKSKIDRSVVRAVFEVSDFGTPHYTTAVIVTNENVGLRWQHTQDKRQCANEYCFHELNGHTNASGRKFPKCDNFPTPEN